MEENYQDYLFTPVCFEKESKKIFKFLNFESNIFKIIKSSDSQNIIYEKENPNSFEYKSSMYTDLSPGLILEKLKDVDHLKLWYLQMEEVTVLMKISQYCDIVNMNMPFFFVRYFNFLKNYKMIRYWSYSQEEHSYFLLFKPLNGNKSFRTLKHGGFIINFNQNLQKTQSLPGCILTFYIKIRKSKISRLVDYFYKRGCEQFCNSLENFIGSVKMHKYNLIINEKMQNNFQDSNYTLDSFRYLIYHLTNIPIEEKVKNNLLFNSNSENKFLLQTYSEIDTRDLEKVQLLFETKNYIKSTYEDGIFPDNEISRFILSIGNDYEKIKISLEELHQYRKNLNNYLLTEGKNFNLDFSKFIKILCKDKLNRPVIYFKMQFLEYLNHYDQTFCKDLTENLYYYILIMFENAAELMSENVDKYFAIIDLKNFSLTKNLEVIFEAISKITNVFQKFYPERLSCAVVINRGYSSTNVFKKVLSMINCENFIKRLKISNNHHEELKDLIPSEHLCLL